jgi:AcrR family transcriptional regulator
LEQQHGKSKPTSGAARRGRPRTFDTDKSLDAAMMLFWRHGYEGTSLSALTRAMKISGPSLYNAFGDKHALFNKALDRYLQLKAVYLPTALREQTVDAVITKLFEGAIDLAMNPKHPDGCMLVHGALATGPECTAIQKALSARRAMAEGALRKRFEMARDAGDLPLAADVERIARYLITIIWGMSVQAAGGATRADLESIAKTTAAFLVDKSVWK